MKLNRALFSLTLPVLLGYIPLGMTFGFLMVSQGIAWYVPLLFSVFVYAGAAQFLAVGLLVNHAPLLDIAVATLLINLRHIFYGLSLFDYLPQTWAKRAYFMFGITDETYSLMTSSPAITPRNALPVVALNQSYWVIGTLMGALLANAVPPIKGIEFSLTALFVILLIEQIKANRSTKLVAMGVLACVLTRFITQQYFLVCASALALIFLSLDYYFGNRKVQGACA